MKNYEALLSKKAQSITLREGELSSSDAIISCVEISGFHCRTEHLLLFESEKLLDRK